MTEKEKYFARIKGLEGLKSVSYSIQPVSPLPKEDDVYAELNRLHSASDCPDEEVLGPYSP